MTSTITTTAGGPTVVGVRAITEHARAAEPGTTRPIAQRLHLRSSTPHLLRAGLAVALAATAVAGVMTAILMEQRRAGAEQLVHDSAPLVATAEGLFVSLADADAVASSAFLAAGREPFELRQRYLGSIRDAGEQLSTLSGLSIDTAARRTISRELPVYAGLIETARANNRLDFPVGAAYLREASTAMSGDLLPAATSIYGDAVSALQSNQSSADVLPVVGAVAAAGAIVAFGVLQVGIAVRFRRRVNPGLVVATVVALVGVLAVAGSIAEQRAELADARAANAQAAVLSSVRILSLRALSDVNLNLVEQGTEPAHLADFDRVVAGIEGDDGLLAVAVEAGVSGERVAVIEEDFGRFMSIESEIRERATSGDYIAATQLAVNDLASAADALDASVAAVIDDTRSSADEAGRRLIDTADGMRVASLAVAAIAALAALMGVRPRLREYR